MVSSGRNSGHHRQRSIWWSPEEIDGVRSFQSQVRMALINWSISITMRIYCRVTFNSGWWSRLASISYIFSTRPCCSTAFNNCNLRLATFSSSFVAWMHALATSFERSAMPLVSSWVLWINAFWHSANNAWRVTIWALLPLLTWLLSSICFTVADHRYQPQSSTSQERCLW